MQWPWEGAEGPAAGAALRGRRQAEEVCELGRARVKDLGTVVRKGFPSQFHRKPLEGFQEAMT